MTDLQQKEFHLLEQFVAICDTLEIPYFLVCGTALGAVKYRGFIPWDDDVDVALFREDYERFLREAPARLPPSLFLQNYRSDPLFPQIYSKLRDSDTTYIEKSVAHLPIHHGVYIDIFPLDGYPDDPKEAKRLERKKWLYSRELGAACLDKISLKGRILRTAARMAGCHRHTAEIAEKYENLLKSYPVQGSKKICNHGNWQGKLEYADASQYGNGTEAVFEGLKVRIPENYEAYLRQKYNDYHADPPKEEQVGHHYYEKMDLHTPYTAYTNRPDRQ